MAGYVLKITIENTHPPVWRRVVIPEKITFENLHEVIQILFDWNDAHLHDFSYPRDYFQVVMSEEDCTWGDLHLETETQVDFYIKQYPWIRYTYDFGDCWEHKIVMEKELEDFQERYAVLLKLRGDHFMEDCGGYFGADDSDRTLADETEINRRLEQLEFSVFESSPVRKSRFEQVEGDDPLEGQMYQVFMNALSKTLEACTEEEREKIFRAILKAPNQFFTPKKSHTSKNSKRLDEWDEDTRTQFVQGNSIQLIFQKTPEKMADLMTDWHRVNLEDYCRYLGISYAANTTKKKMAADVSSACVSHPEYVQMFFSEPELMQLKKYLDALAKNKPCAYEDNDGEHTTITKAVCMGIFRLETLGKQRLIHVASDATALVKAVFASDWKAYYKKIAAFGQAIRTVLLMYGMADMDYLQACCERILGSAVDQNEFRRIVYWHGRMNEMIQTGMWEDTGEIIVMIPDIENKYLSRIVSCVDSDRGYKQYGDEEVEAWKEGILSAMPEWLEYGELLEILSDDDDIDMLLFEDYVSLVGGKSVTDFLEDLYESYGEEMEPGMRANLWEVVMWLAVHVPQAGLKGYSRAEYAALTGKPLDELGLFDKTKLERRVNKQTMLCHFPAELQMEMYLASENENKGAYLNCLKRLQKKYKSNEELTDLCGLVESEWALINNPGLEEDMLMYEQLLDQREANIYPWDEDVFEMFKPEIPTFVREQPKIGRHDPCPCGSGKKYKKCCGRS